jgi:HK97 gp10 family phage protein
MQVTGLKELQAALRNVTPVVEGRIMGGAINAGIAVFRDDARQRVESPKLRKGIKVRAVKARRGSIIREVYIDRKSGAYYATWLEFGTASFYTGKGRTVGGPYNIPKSAQKKMLSFDGKVRKSVRHPGIKPQPYMRPAFDANGAKAVERMKAYIRIRLPMELGKTTKTRITRQMIDLEEST